jgi:DHA2 family multidrug resistance protein
MRLLLATGFGLTAFSLWQMSGYAPALSQSDIVWPGVIQGIGLGLVFVPLSAATFATLSPQMRAQGTAIYSLVRNIGSSIGIALVQTLLVRNTQTVHESLVQHITYANPELAQAVTQSGASGSYQAGMAMLNNEITRQASMIAYLDDFWLMFIMTLCVIPLLVLIRAPGKQAATVDHAVME